MNRTPSDVRPQNRQRGFVLVAVLVALVILALLATAIATTSERALHEAHANADAFEAETAMISTRDTLLFMFSTQRQTYAGLTIDNQVVWMAGQATATRSPGEDDLPPPLPVGNEIRLDGTPYRGIDGAVFSLRDDAGKVSPNWTFGFYRPGLFNLLAVPPGNAQSMEAMRLDYQDPDSLFRLGGAEADDYRRKNMAPPTNRPLATPLETRRIMGWNDALRKFDDHTLCNLLTTSINAEININTASAEALQTLPGVDREIADRMIAMRSTMPFMLIWQLRDTFKLPLDELDPVGTLPNGKGTLQLWHNAGGPIRSVHWTLTPDDEGGKPWRLNYSLVLPRDPVSDQTPARSIPSPLFANSGQAGQ